MSRTRPSRTELSPLRLARSATKRLAVFSIALLAATASRAEIDRAAFVRLSHSVLKIEVIRAQGGYSLGSGVVVGPERVVTNCHVTRDATEIHVLRDGLRLGADAQTGDVDHDLCLLHVPHLEASAVALGHADGLRLGQSLVALGYTGGTGMQHSAGDVIVLHRFDGSRVIQSSNWFNSGASGGGLFDDQLRLVGILTFRLRGGAAHYFSAPVEWVAALLPGDRPTRSIGPFGAQELAFWQRPIKAQPPFLQAAVLERDRDWPALEGLSVSWSRQSPADPEPWYLQGEALSALDRLPAAREAFERSVELEPGRAAAWYRLGLVYAKLGQGERAHAAFVRLEPLDADLAADLARQLEPLSVKH